MFNLIAACVGVFLFLVSFNPHDPALAQAIFAVVYFYLLGLHVGVTHRTDKRSEGASHDR